MPPVVSKVRSATFSFFLENHCDLCRPPVENVPSLVGLVGTKKVGFLTRPTVRCKQYNVYWKPGCYNKSDYYTKHHPVAHHHRNVRPYYVFDPQQPDKYYSTQVNYYAPLDDSDDDTVDTVPTTDSESDTDYSSDEETIVASNCSRQSSATGGVGEGVLKSQSRVTHIPGLSSLASSATPVVIILLMLETLEIV